MRIKSRAKKAVHTGKHVISKVSKATNHPKAKLNKKMLKTKGMATKAESKEDAAEPKTRSTKSKREAVANLYTEEEITAAVNELSRNEAASGYLKKNVSTRALDVINKLVVPKTDEALAAELDMKINAVRRILNMMQHYGITNYYIAKNVNGWLSFAWYINISKLPPFFDYIDSIENKKPTINNDCNDYFVCNNCYDATKLIFTFDAAFEENFKCGSCGKSLAMLDKIEATKLISAPRTTE
jgi:transcription factor E